MSRVVIYTDLDGSLLDHDSYSHAAADSLLDELAEQGVPVIPVSSKTRAELLVLRSELDNPHPFIAENGAAVFIPAGYFGEQPHGTVVAGDYHVREFSLPRRYWLETLASAAAEFRDDYRGFEEMSVDEIVALTGLARADAERAAQREYGEPLRWHGSDERKAAFLARMEQHGATILQGGRFMHISGDCDKGRALLWLNAQFAKLWGEKPVSIAIGDSHNDTAMLEAADHALVIRSPSHAPPELSRTHDVLLSEGYGPVGWNAGVRTILQKIETTEPTDG
jgi:mannosyl-3-phosphoglycerate phosphatase family protein